MLLVIFSLFSRATDVARSFRLIVQLHRLCEGSALGNWDPREGQKPFRPNTNEVRDHTTTSRCLLIGPAFFLRPLRTYVSPRWFPFFSITNITKLECLQRAASLAISGCLSPSPIPIHLSEASLLPLRVTLTHFPLSPYERVLRLSTSFPISGLAIRGVKPRLCKSFWEVFASTHPFISREALCSTSLSSMEPVFLHYAVRYILPF